MRQRNKVEIFDTSAQLAERAADLIAGIISETLLTNDRISLVLSGGSTPKTLYTLLASENYYDKIPWEKVLIFFGDERCVPPDHSESNYKMASDALLSKVPIPAENIFRMKGEIDPAQAASEYEAQIKNVLGSDPHFDIVLLGMGPDGHTASLFPGTTALDESEKLVAANYVEKLNTWRLTLTLPAINSAKNILFMVAGNDKAKMVKTVFDTAQTPLPCKLVQPAAGKLIWMLDKDAASLIQ